ncbi:hypothetical protein B0B52_13315 [Polaromonas sp. A23]|nr:hypothetical protein B0B52_13315 [Polaromonas sp. A23]
MVAWNAVKNTKSPVVNKRTTQIGKVERLRFRGAGFLECLQLLRGQTAHVCLVQAAAWYFKSGREWRLWFMAFIFHTSTYSDAGRADVGDVGDDAFDFMLVRFRGACIGYE